LVILEKNMKNTKRVAKARAIKSLATLGLVGCAVMNSPLAVADDAFWYVGGNIGQSQARIDDGRIVAQLLDAMLTTTAISNDDRDTAYKLFGGYRINKNFALEAGYFNLGQFGYTATTVPAGTLSGKIKLQGLNLDAVGMLPLTEKFAAFGRLGINYAQAKDTFTSTGLVPVPADPNPGKNALNYKAGLGIQYDFTKSLGMRAEAERYRINDAVGNKGDINMYSFGLVYRFGHKEEPVPVPAPKEAPPPVIVAAEPLHIAAAPEAPSIPVLVIMPAPMKVVFSADSSADALFDFGKEIVKPNGQRALDKFAADLTGADFSVITITGHTDRIGSHAYNMKLSARRAEAVKAYLVESAGIPADKIIARGVDGTVPMTKPGECKGTKATKKLIACLGPDRRVEVEVTATRTSN
jgi:OOP family OmpA-OmpF porin